MCPPRTPNASYLEKGMCKKAQDFFADHVEPSDNTDSTNCHARAVAGQPVIADIWVHTATTLRGMCGGHSGTAKWVFFFVQLPRFPLSASFCLSPIFIRPWPMPFNLTVDSAVK